MSEVDTSVSFDEIEQELLAVEELIAQARVRQAELLATIDSFEGYRMDGAAGLREWTRGRLDVSDATAKDLVTAARSLTDRPQLRDLAETRRVSFDRLVATARLVAAGADDVTVRRSLGHDLGGVGQLVALRRRITRDDEAAMFADEYVALQPSLDRTRGRVYAELVGVGYTVVEKALTERADRFRLPGPRIAKPQRLANALVSIAHDSLDPTPADDGAGAGNDGGGASTGSRRRLRPLVTVLVDADLAADTKGEAGAEVAYGPRVGPNTLDAMLCTGAVRIVGLHQGTPVVISDTADTIPPAVRDAVMARDKACVVEGCHSRYRLQVHHLRHRSDNGGHEMTNLATLCWFHHHVVIHNLGFQIDPDSPPQRLRFLRRSPTPSRTRAGPDPP